MSNSNGFDASKAMDQIKSDRNLMIVAVGAAAVIVGLFLPWYTIDILGFSTSASPGLSNSTGILLLVFSLAAVASGLNVMNHDKRKATILTVVMGVLATLIMLNNWPDSALGEVVQTGLGYWLGLAGSVAMVVGGVMRKQAQNGSGRSKPAAGSDSDS